MANEARESAARLGWLGVCEVAWKNPYIRQFYIAVASFTALLISADSFAEGASGPIGTLVVLSPVLPAVWAMWSLMMYLRGVDELERLKQIEALTLAFGVTLVMMVVATQLEAGGRASVRVNDLLAVMLFSWPLGYVVAAWRYR